MYKKNTNRSHQHNEQNHYLRTRDAKHDAKRDAKRDSRRLEVQDVREQGWGGQVKTCQRERGRDALPCDK